MLGDSEVLRMAIVQLLENGLKYSPSDSEVSVFATCMEDEVRLSVHNDGTFIPQEERTGLGLSIAKRAVEMHQGVLRVESSRQNGTTFQILIPKGEPC